MSNQRAEVHRQLIFDFTNFGRTHVRVEPVEFFGKELVQSSENEGRVVIANDPVLADHLPA